MSRFAPRLLVPLACLAAALTAVGCGDDGAPTSADAADPGPDAADAAGGGALYSLGSVVIQPDGTRTTYVQTIPSLDVATVDNSRAIELPGNGLHLARAGHVYIGLAEEPTMVRYTPDADGQLVEDGRVSFLNQGVARVGFGNVFVSDTRAYMIAESEYVAVVWDPSAMEIVTTIDLAYLKQEGLDAEFWTVAYRDGKVYIPVRYANWNTGVIGPSVTLVIVDAATDTILATATDDRCASGGRPVFAPNGDAYVVADGRNWSAQLFATVTGQPVPPTCLLRLRAGETTFDPDFLVTLPSLTGFDAATELNPAADGEGTGYLRVFRPEMLPRGVEIGTDFAFWGYRAFEMWRLDFANAGAGEDAPRAVAVPGLPLSSLGFTDESVDGKLYVGDSPDYTTTTIYELDPAAPAASGQSADGVRPLFEMQGAFYGLHRLR
jgi:hypothetical protein